MQGVYQRCYYCNKKAMEISTEGFPCCYNHAIRISVATISKNANYSHDVLKSGVI